MTYLEFHLVFLLPPLLGLALGGVPKGSRVAGYLLMPLIALLWTTPWDNYLVYRGVWTYPPERVWFRIGYVPFEEYLFFVLQPLLTGLVAHRLFQPGPGGPAWARSLGGMGFLLLSLLGGLLFQNEKGVYLGLILLWFGPPLALQWAFGGDLLLGALRPYLLSVLLPTLYLWCADLLAIRMGIWAISERYTLGIAPFGLPLEEMVFFLVVNLAIVQGLFLIWHPEARRRLQRLQGGKLS